MLFSIHFQEDYMVEVEKIAKIKQKQEEDISAARLHSFRYVLLDLILEKVCIVMFHIGK